MKPGTTRPPRASSVLGVGHGAADVGGGADGGDPAVADRDGVGARTGGVAGPDVAVENAEWV